MREKRIRRPADVFADALDRPAEERREFLRRVYADAPDLLAEVESLLLAHAQMEAESLMKRTS